MHKKNFLLIYSTSFLIVLVILSFIVNILTLVGFFFMSFFLFNILEALLFKKIMGIGYGTPRSGMNFDLYSRSHEATHYWYYFAIYAVLFILSLAFIIFSIK